MEFNCFKVKLGKYKSILSVMEIDQLGQTIGVPSLNKQTLIRRYSPDNEVAVTIDCVDGIKVEFVPAPLAVPLPLLLLILLLLLIVLLIVLTLLGIGMVDTDPGDKSYLVIIHQLHLISKFVYFNKTSRTFPISIKLRSF